MDVFPRPSEKGTFGICPGAVAFEACLDGVAKAPISGLLNVCQPRLYEPH